MLCVLSGLNWSNGSLAGVGSLNLNNARTNGNWNVGVRADCDSVLKPQEWGVESQGGRFLRDAKSAAGGFLVGDLPNVNRPVFS